MFEKTTPASVSECAAEAKSWMLAEHGSPQAGIVAECGGKDTVIPPARPATPNPNAVAGGVAEAATPAIPPFEILDVRSVFTENGAPAILNCIFLKIDK